MQYIINEHAINLGNILNILRLKKAFTLELLSADIAIRNPDMEKNTMTENPPSVVEPKNEGSLFPHNA